MKNSEYIDYIAKQMVGSRNSQYWERVKQEEKEVDCVNVFDALTFTEVGCLLVDIKPQPRMCYKNALITALTFHCEYVEGYVNINGVPVEHAFCKKNGKYFDPTLDVVDVRFNVESHSYTSIYEKDYKEALQMAEKLGLYGPFASYEYSNITIPT